jgi:asparagine synthase (glutamine-hydrolysing)
MCGICGFVDLSNRYNHLNRQRIISEMTNTLIHRGPDDEGYWHDEAKGVSLGHRRLSILDLSSHGSQPMLSNSGRYAIVFNGEIYNHSLLRNELIKSGVNISWRGHSDTETLLTCIDEWGIEKSIKKTTGMFAVAIFDNKENNLFLARDRIGEKPLYYGFQNGVFLFGSELKAINKHPNSLRVIDRNAIALQFSYSYIPTPYSIYKGIKKLKAGTILRVNLSKSNIMNEILEEPKTYWSLEEVVIESQKNIYTGNSIEAINDLDDLLGKSVRDQMVADVPLGAFLSGGIDSSLIVSLMQSQTSMPIETFTIGFSEADYNEAIYANKIAKHLGTKHTELYVSSNDALSVVDKLPQIYDEPFSDSSQIPTYLISEMAKKNVTVSLSGDAGDELFGGYNRYLWIRQIWSRMKFIPISLRKFISYGMTSVSPSVWNMILKQILDTPQPGDKMHKLSSILTSVSADDCYLNLISHWNILDNIVIGANDISTSVTDIHDRIDFDSIEDKMMYLDSISYLPDDILTKIDRASMCVSLETRVPFLNHQVVEFANALPLSMKIKNGESKWILRQLLYKYIPKDLIERPKMGFGIPIDIWLRGPLRDWAESLLNKSRIENEGYLNYEPIKRKWDEHLSGKRNWQYHLWDVLMFQAWLERNK